MESLIGEADDNFRCGLRCVVRGLQLVDNNLVSLVYDERFCKAESCLRRGGEIDSELGCNKWGLELEAPNLPREHR